jgi:hypothetical protein
MQDSYHCIYWLSGVGCQAIKEFGSHSILDEIKQEIASLSRLHRLKPG